MDRIGTTDLKTQVGRVMDRIEKGEELLLTRRGRAIARIIPLPQRSRAEVVDEILRLRAGHPAVEVATVVDWIAEGRDA